MWILYIEWLTSQLGAIEWCAVLCQHVTIMHCTMHDPSCILLCITLSGQCTLHTWYQNSKCSKIQGVANDNFFFYFGIPGVKTGPPEDWNINFCTYMKSRPQNQCTVKFWWSSIKNKNFTNLTFRGPRGPNGGPKPKIFNLYEIRAPK